MIVDCAFPALARLRKGTWTTEDCAAHDAFERYGAAGAWTGLAALPDVTTTNSGQDLTRYPTRVAACAAWHAHSFVSVHKTELSCFPAIGGRNLLLSLLNPGVSFPLGPKSFNTIGDLIKILDFDDKRPNWLFDDRILNLNHAATMRPKCLHATPKKQKTKRISWNKRPL